MPDGLGRTAWDHAKGNASKLRLLAWATSPVHAVLPPRIRSLATQAFLQLSTADMAALRKAGVEISRTDRKHR